MIQKVPIEKSLRKSINLNYRKMFKELSNFIGINYTVMDKEGNFIIQNEYFLREFAKIKKATELPEAWNDCLKIMKHGKKVTVEEEYGNKFFISIKKPLFDNKEECIGIMVLSFDITSQKQSEIMKRRFLDSIHHDIKTPFVGLHMLSGSMANRETDENKKHSLNLINMCAKRLVDYLSTILDMVSSKSYKNYEKCRFNLREVIESVSAMLTPLIVEKNLQLIINCPNEYVKSNKINFEKILLNLLSNAVKFTEKGTVTINVELKNHSLKLSVTDTGIGIAKKDREIIFEQFHRVTPSYHEPEFRGCGLGLSLAKSLVEKMNGKINVQSTLKKGSTFNIFIPLL